MELSDKKNLIDNFTESPEIPELSKYLKRVTYNTKDRLKIKCKWMK